MAKKMLINVMHPEEARVAIVEDGRLVELDVEIAGSEQTRGNIYKGVVVRVEPGLQAAFVDIGLKKLGFLQMGELHPDYWQWREDIPEENRKRRPRIQEVLRRGQELIVQVEKGERDMKGAALTTYLSMPGRYMVIMPGSDSTGISRKVESESERKKLKEIVAEMEIPDGIGYIIRTEAVGKKKAELTKDLHYLVKLYETIREQATQVKGAALIYQESGLVIRTIRDYFTAEIDEVLVDSKDVYKQAREFFKETMPKSEKLVKLHQEKRPIFSRYQLEEQIDQIYEKKVPLKSGGSLVIEPTEALVSIDVNSGKSTGEKGVEDTAFKTNLEAAEEAARQLRLRDLGGLIVIDFIDMRDKKHMAEVEKTLKAALKLDKARVTVGKISQFGMLEMSRQRIKQTLEQASYLECPHCYGRGKVKSVESMALSFLRKVHASAAKGTVAEVRGGLPLEVAYYLLNRKKRELAQIETDYEIEVTVKGKPSFLMNQLEVDLIRREKHLHEEPVHEPVAEAVPTPVVEKAVTDLEIPGAVAPVAGEEVKAKKKRRRGKKKPKVEEAAASGTVTEELAEQPQVEEEAPETVEGEPAKAEEAGEESGMEGGPAEEQRKKRRRRRRRGGKAVQAEGVIAETGEEAPTEVVAPEAEPAAETEEVVATEGEVVSEEVKKKRRRRRRRTKPAVSGEAAAESASPEYGPESEPAVELSQQAELPAVVAEAPGEQKRKPARPRRKKEKPAESEAVAEPAPAVVMEPVVETAKPRRSRAKKAVAAEPVAEIVEAVAPVTGEGEEKPKKKRAPRKKAPVSEES